jgi:hypothetical protein
MDGDGAHRAHTGSPRAGELFARAPHDEATSQSGGQDSPGWCSPPLAPRKQSSSCPIRCSDSVDEKRLKIT